jgi:hypothetical protein
MRTSSRIHRFLPSEMVRAAFYVYQVIMRNDSKGCKHKPIAKKQAQAFNRNFCGGRVLSTAPASDFAEAVPFIVGVGVPCSGAVAEDPSTTYAAVPGGVACNDSSGVVSSACVGGGPVTRTIGAEGLGQEVSGRSSEGMNIWHTGRGHVSKTECFKCRSFRP